MTNLEWVNNQLEDCDKVIKQLNIRKDEDKKYPSLVKSYNEQIENIMGLKQRFEQIKSELEAWEIAKAKEIDLYDVITSQDIEEFNCDLYKDYQLTEEEFNKLKKALEVKENELHSNK